MSFGNIINKYYISYKLLPAGLEPAASRLLGMRSTIVAVRKNKQNRLSYGSKISHSNKWVSYGSWISHSNKCVSYEIYFKFATTRNRTWVPSATTRSTNHYTIVAKKSTSAGFEPTRAEPNGLAVHHLNHSAMMSKMPSARLELATFRSSVWRSPNWAIKA